MSWADDPFKVRFLERINVREDGCWIWVGQDGGRYGRFYAGDPNERWAHRIAWSLHHGKRIPDGIEIHHRCQVGKCVNPAHLEALTAEEHDARHPAVTGRPHGLAKSWVEGCRCDICAEAVREYRRGYLERTRREAQMGLRQIPHGTKNGYTTYACRCDACTRASTEAMRAIRSRRPRSPRAPRRTPEHGTTTMYTAYKCRCDACRKCWSDYWKAYRLRKRAEAEVAS